MIWGVPESKVGGLYNKDYNVWGLYRGRQGCRSYGQSWVPRIYIYIYICIL